MQGRGGVVARRTQDPSSGGCLWAVCVQGADSSGQTGVALREPPPRQPATAVKGEHRPHAGTVPARVLLTRREPSQHVTDEGTKGPGGE